MDNNLFDKQDTDAEAHLEPQISDEKASEPEKMSETTTEPADVSLKAEAEPEAEICPETVIDTETQSEAEPEPQMGDEKASEPEKMSETTTEPAEVSLKAEATAEKPKPKRSFATTACEYAETFCYAVALMIVLFLFVFRYVTVVGESMRDTLQDKDNLIISDMFYEPKTGDIVVINRSSRSKPLIKRVIAAEGQSVKIDFNTWEVWVDGVKLDESYVTLHPDGIAMHNNQFTSQYTDADNICEFVVDDDCVFVMGDNRNNSQDSRYYGLFTRHEIVGRVIFRVAPNIGVVK